MTQPSKQTITRRGFLRTAWQAAFYSIFAGGSSVWMDTKAEPQQLKHIEVEIPITGLPAVFDGYRIVHLTDIHFGPAIAYETVILAIEAIRRLASGLVALTGDFVTYTLDDALLVDALKRLAAPDGVWAVMGNHDHWTDVEGVRRSVQQAGVSELRNAHTRIARQDESIWLAGVDDVWEVKHDLNAALDGIPNDAATILLAHEPDYADEVAPTHRVSLQLSGHSHGGQVRIPVLDVPVLSNFVYLARKYPRGLYRVGSMWLYTSAGVGRGPIPRVYAAPELTEIVLRRA